ncbi:MAG: hypothetical protein ONB27_14865, partial [candidate division KSB1 bacterium]|nr:hypothetical protein [candidate division KSB1 bacterium]
MKKGIAIKFFTLWVAAQGLAQPLDFQGQISGWTTINGIHIDQSQLGLRYLPELNAKQSLAHGFTLNADLALNAYGSGRFDGWNKFDTNGKVKLYRFWLRFASSQFEARLGLQKINFGSATLLRPLMWFDRVDPRDPLQLTDGVYALLLRYYFLNNANFWLWGLYGNKETKGWEIIPSDAKKIEFGGRWQMPVYKGEFGITYHHRQADLKKGLLGQMPLGDQSMPEDRLGLDGKWDVGIGMWLEAAIIHQQIDLPKMKYQRLMNIGLDYTFSLGNGLHAMLENFVYETANKAFVAGESIQFSALSLSYSLGLLDRLTGMIYYDWKNENWYRFFSWQRSYDRWQIFLIGFWNP